MSLKMLRDSRGFLVGPGDVLRCAGRLLWGSLGLLELFVCSPGESPGHFWGNLGCAWEVLGGSLGEPVGDQVLQTLRTPMFQRLLCFPCSSTLFLVFLI